MPFDSNGNAQINRTIAVSGQTVQAIQVNVPFDDVQSMLNQVLLRSGIAPLSGNLSAGGFKLTNLANGSADGDSINMSQLNAQASNITNAAPPGAVQGFRRKTAPTGWIAEIGGTIGSSSSGATTRANQDTLALFTVLWGDFSNAELPIQDSSGAPTTRGASALADFNANKRLSIFDARSRFLRGTDTGIGVGLSQEDEIKGHVHTGTTDIGGGAPPTVQSTASSTAVTSSPIQPTLLTLNNVNGNLFSGAVSANPHSHNFTTNSTGGSETRPKASVVLYCIKL